MADKIISTADLSAIERNLSMIHDHLQQVNSNVVAVDSHVDTVEGELQALTDEFHTFVNQQVRANRKQFAETRLVEIRQELEKRFGHYDVVRRTATGILQATDLGMIREESIHGATEDLMIKTPGYWLAPALVALSAWISDKPELAQKAMREALQRDDEKTSLFFSLVCRRADRKIACLKWVGRYLANQDETALDRKTILVLAAYANGLWGTDAEGHILRRIDEWMENLERQPDFIAKQRQQWFDAIQLKRPNLDGKLDYQYLPKYSETWPELVYILSGAYLHKELSAYFQQIFAQENATGKLKEQLDGVLDSLVTEFDDAELKFREDEKLEQLVIECDGDEAEAKRHMKVAQTAFETNKDFIQLLTDAAMNPELAHADAATQKFAIALSRDWIVEAYRDVIAANRSRVPQTVAIAVDDFTTSSEDGTNEADVLAAFDAHINQAQTKAMEGRDLTQFDQACKYGSYVLGVVALALLFGGAILYGIGCGAVAWFAHHRYKSRKQAYEQAQRTVQELEERRKTGKELLRAILAEIVDVRQEFAEKDKDAHLVLDFLEGLDPDQFVGRMDTTRRVMVQKG